MITGRGWGHGVGLSQYGALGFARQGAGYEEILAHYYQGTELTEAPVKRMRVLLAAGAKTLDVGSRAPFRARDALGRGRTSCRPAHSDSARDCGSARSVTRSRLSSRARSSSSPAVSRSS